MEVQGFSGCDCGTVTVPQPSVIYNNSDEVNNPPRATFASAFQYEIDEYDVMLPAVDIPSMGLQHCEN